VKVKGMLAKTTGGTGFVPDAISPVREVVVDAVKAFMVSYGVAKFDVGFAPFGGVTTYRPSVADMLGLPKRPTVLEQAMVEVFKTLAPCLFLHGVMSVELTDLEAEDLDGIKKLWQAVDE